MSFYDYCDPCHVQHFCHVVKICARVCTSVYGY